VASRRVVTHKVRWNMVVLRQARGANGKAPDYHAGPGRRPSTIVAMPPDLLLAIDVGTQSVRAIVFDRDRSSLARAQTVLTPAFRAPRPGWAEQDLLVR